VISAFLACAAEIEGSEVHRLARRQRQVGDEFIHPLLQAVLGGDDMPDAAHFTQPGHYSQPGSQSQSIVIRGLPQSHITQCAQELLQLP